MVLLLHGWEISGEVIPATNPLNFGVVVSLGAVMGGLFLWANAGTRENSRFRVRDLNVIVKSILAASVVLYMGSVVGYVVLIFFRPQERSVPVGDAVGWGIELALTYVFCTFAMTLALYVDESADIKAYRRERKEENGRWPQRIFVRNILCFPENYPQAFGPGVAAGETVRVSARSEEGLTGEWGLLGRSVLSLLPGFLFPPILWVVTWVCPGSLGGFRETLMCVVQALGVWYSSYVLSINLLAVPLGLLVASRSVTVVAVRNALNGCVIAFFTCFLLGANLLNVSVIRQATATELWLSGLAVALTVFTCLAGFTHGALKGIVPAVRRSVANNFQFLPDGTVEIVPEESVALRSPGMSRGKLRWLADLLDPRVPSRLLLGAVGLGQRYICAVLPDRPVDDSADRT